METEMICTHSIVLMSTAKLVSSSNEIKFEQNSIIEIDLR